MTKHIEDLKGKKFNRLFIIEFAETRGKSKHAYWIGICNCGKKKIVRASHLKTGSVKSCGCYASEVFSEKLRKYASSDKHKGANNPMWKGKDTKYPSIHTWLSKNHKKPSKCSHCEKEKKLDWALIKNRKHDHDINNYMALCRSCHLKYDYTDERRKKMGEMLNLTKKNKKSL